GRGALGARAGNSHRRSRHCAGASFRRRAHRTRVGPHAAGLGSTHEGAHMRKVLFLFADLSDADVEWLAAAGERQSIPEGSVLIRPGEPIRVVYTLLDGQLSVHLEHRTERIATLQRGEIVGELSFLDARPPSATVTAATDSIVLAIARDKLRARLERDTA